MVHHVLALAAIFFFWLAPAASAQPAEPLTQEEAAAALFGHDLTGVEIGSVMPWNECIDIRGETLWRVPGFTSEGRLTVRPDGRACFRYSHTNYGEEECWFVRREGERLQFDHVSGEGGVYLALARRRVAACGEEPPIA